jgi:hypothetical protein
MRTNWGESTELGKNGTEFGEHNTVYLVTTEAPHGLRPYRCKNQSINQSILPLSAMSKSYIRMNSTHSWIYVPNSASRRVRIGDIKFRHGSLQLMRLVTIGKQCKLISKSWGGRKTPTGEVLERKPVNSLRLTQGAIGRERSILRKLSVRLRSSSPGAGSGK